MCVPVAVFLLSRKNKFSISKQQLLLVAIFGIAFGFVEASVVIYLRAALGFLPNYTGTLSDIINNAGSYNPSHLLKTIPTGLFTVEFFREAATMVMLTSIGLLSARRYRERFILFLWAFAFWDLFYYVGLWIVTRWPESLTTQDVLFLIPVPWISQVWFPFLVSGLTILLVAINSRKSADLVS